MIDIHCHLLPGIDDGACDEEEALQMARLACEDGITDVIVTPHMQNGLYHINAKQVLEETAKLQGIIDGQQLPLRVHPGAEVHIHPMLLENLDQQKLLTLCHPNDYLLLELPLVSIPEYTYGLIQELLLGGVTPIIAHPERYIFIKKELTTMIEWIELGAITQVNAGSLLGFSGRKVQRMTRELIKNRMVHVIASDGHNARTRKPLLAEAYQEIKKITSIGEVNQLMENAQAILKGKTCEVQTPTGKHIQWKSWWRF